MSHFDFDISLGGGEFTRQSPQTTAFEVTDELKCSGRGIHLTKSVLDQDNALLAKPIKKREENRFQLLALCQAGFFDCLSWSSIFVFSPTTLGTSPRPQSVVRKKTHHKYAIHNSLPFLILFSWSKMLKMHRLHGISHNQKKIDISICSQPLCQLLRAVTIIHNLKPLYVNFCCQLLQ